MLGYWVAIGGQYMYFLPLGLRLDSCNMQSDSHLSSVTSEKSASSLPLPNTASLSGTNTEPIRDDLTIDLLEEQFRADRTM